MKIEKAIQVAIQAQVPVLIWGAPGVGKTSYLNALAKALDAYIETVIASIREPSDFAGLPIANGDGVHFAPPSWAKRLAASLKKIILLFMDEISTAPPAVQAALLRVVLERMVGDLQLPFNVSIIAAANPPEQAAGGWELSPPLANRFCHLDWNTDAIAWSDGMTSGWPAPRVVRLPDNWLDEIHQARSLVSSYVRTRQTVLLNVPKDEGSAGRAWPSPRTWDMTARCMAACASINERIPGDTITMLVAGCVGDAAAMEFTAWVRDLDLPDPEALLKNPKSLKMPARGDQQYAVLSSVLAAVKRQLTLDRWTAAWQVLDIASKQKAPDIAASVACALADEQNMPPGAKAPIEAREFLPMLREAGLLGGRE